MPKAKAVLPVAAHHNIVPALPWHGMAWHCQVQCMFAEPQRSSCHLVSSPAVYAACSDAQINGMSVQVSEASASGADLDTLSEELFKQLSTGHTVNLGSIFRPARHTSALPSAVALSQPSAAQQQQHLHRAAQAISAAATAAAVNQGTTPAALLGTIDAAKGHEGGEAPASVSGLIRVASELPAAESG